MPDCKQYGGINRDELVNLRKDLASEGIVVPEGDDVGVQGPFAFYNWDFDFDVRIVFVNRGFACERV